MDDLIKDTVDTYSIETTTRIGMRLITFYKDFRPLGSLLLDPVEDKLILDSINDIPKNWNRSEQQRIERERVRSNGRKSKRNDP